MNEWRTATTKSDGSHAHNTRIFYWRFSHSWVSVNLDGVTLWHCRSRVVL